MTLVLLVFGGRGGDRMKRQTSPHLTSIFLRRPSAAALVGNRRVEALTVPSQDGQ